MSDCRPAANAKGIFPCAIKYGRFLEVGGLLAALLPLHGVLHWNGSHGQMSIGEFWDHTGFLSDLAFLLPAARVLLLLIKTFFFKRPVGVFGWVTLFCLFPNARDSLHFFAAAF